MKHLLMIVILGMPFSLVAEEMHHHHDAGVKSEVVTVVAGTMAPTGEGLSTAQRCELARRGVVMLDNGAWSACGGKPMSVPASVVPQLAAPVQHHHEHGGH